MHFNQAQSCLPTTEKEFETMHKKKCMHTGIFYVPPIDCQCIPIAPFAVLFITFEPHMVYLRSHSHSLVFKLGGGGGGEFVDGIEADVVTVVTQEIQSIVTAAS